MTFCFSRALIITSIIWGALILSDAQAACGQSYSIGYSSDYIPYQYKNAEGIPAGLDIDLTEAIMAEMGCEYSFKLMPSKRAQVLLKRGTLDLMPAASITDECQIYANFSAPYRDENMVMFIRTEDQGKYQFYTLKSAIDNRLRIVAGLGGWYGVEYGEQKERALLNGALTLNSRTEIRMHQLLDYRADLGAVLN